MLQTVKVLNMYQPWASLVAIGAKEYETRSWACRYQGPLAIYATKHVEAGDMTWVDDCDSLAHAHLARHFPSPLGAYGRDDGPEHRLSRQLPFGKIVAMTYLEGCAAIPAPGPLRMDNRIGLTWTVNRPGQPPLFAHVQVDEDSDEVAFGDWSPFRFAWSLRNVVGLHTPIAARPTNQGMWDWEIDPDLAVLLDARGWPNQHLT